VVVEVIVVAAATVE